MRRFTAIVQDGNEWSTVAVMQVEARDIHAARDNAARALYDEQHEHWTDDELEDAPFYKDDYRVVAVFEGWQEQLTDGD